MLVNKTAKYNILELLESPSRLNSISHSEIIDIAKKALVEDKQFDRFAALMKTLERNEPGLYLGFVFAASDLFPIDLIFRKQLNEFKLKTKSIENCSEYKIFTSILEACTQFNLINDERYKTKIFNNMASLLPEDCYDFVIRCMKKEDHDLFFKAFKQMAAQKMLSANTLTYFSFGLNKTFETTNKITGICIPIKSYEVYTCVGGRMLFDKDMNDVTDQFSQIIEYINLTSRDFTATSSGKKVTYPIVFQVYINESNRPVLFVSNYNYIIPKNVKLYNLTDESLINFIKAGVKSIICVNQNRAVVSMLTDKNKQLVEGMAEIEEVEEISISLAISNKTFKLFRCVINKETGEHLNIIGPDHATIPAIKPGKKLKIRYCKFGSNYILI